MQDTLSALRVAFGKGQIHLAKSLHLSLAQHVHHIYFFIAHTKTVFVLSKTDFIGADYVK